MSQSASASLKDLHELQQRARALRDRLTSAPKLIAVREAAVKHKQSTLDAARKALQDAKVRVKTQEAQLKTYETKIEDLRVKLNLAKKNDEYKAIVNQIAHEEVGKGKVEEQVLEIYGKLEEESAALASLEAEVKTFVQEAAAFKEQIEKQCADHRAQLGVLEPEIVRAEEVIPPDDLERYRHVVRHRGPDALSAIENGACAGCYVSVTMQQLSEVIMAERMSFCLSCGRILYMSEQEEPKRKRRGSVA